jgi:hypothetical protein
VRGLKFVALEPQNVVARGAMKILRWPRRAAFAASAQISIYEDLAGIRSIVWQIPSVEPLLNATSALSQTTYF